MKAAMKKLKGPLGLSLLAAALTAAALAAVSVAQDDGKAKSDKSATERADRPGPPPHIEELSAEDQEAMESFRSCMEENGAPAPPAPPAPGEEGQGNGDVFEHRLEPPSEEERAKIEKAHEACADKLPEGARAFPGGPGGPGGPCGPPPGGKPEEQQ